MRNRRHVCTCVITDLSIDFEIEDQMPARFFRFDFSPSTLPRELLAQVAKHTPWTVRRRIARDPSKAEAQREADTSST